MDFQKIAKDQIDWFSENSQRLFLFNGSFFPQIYKFETLML